MWWSNIEMATLPEKSPLCQALQCYCQTSHVSIFPAMGVQPQPTSHSDFYFYLCKRYSLKICPLIPAPCWASHFSEDTEVDSTPAFSAHLGQQDKHCNISYYKGRNGFAWRASIPTVLFPSRRNKKKTPSLLLHQNHLLAFLTSTHVVTIRTGLLGSGTGGILNRHTGTHQNICELPKWNWHHGSGLYHTSEKGFTAEIKQINSSAPCPARAAWCWAAIVTPLGCFTWLPASPLHFAGSEVKHKENWPELQQGTCKRTETADFNSIFPLRQKHHQHYRNGTQECFSL